MKSCPLPLAGTRRDLALGFRATSYTVIAMGEYLTSHMASVGAHPTRRRKITYMKELQLSRLEFEIGLVGNDLHRRSQLERLARGPVVRQFNHERGPTFGRLGNFGRASVLLQW